MGGLGLEIVENCPMSSLRGTFSSGKEVVEGEAELGSSSSSIFVATGHYTWFAAVAPDEVACRAASRHHCFRHICSGDSC